jgi:hypothetical protein
MTTTSRLRAFIGAAALALGILTFASPAGAQIPPLPLPTIPPEAQPVLEIVAPIVSPQCGNATLVVALAPGIVGGAVGPLPIDILPLLGPAFVICGSVPVPAPDSQLVCAVDDQILAAITQVTLAAAGIPPPVDLRIVGPLAEILVGVEDNLPAPANTAGLGETAAATLACRAVRPPTSTQSDAASAVEATSTDVPTDVATDALALPDFSVGDISAPVDLSAGGTAPAAQAPTFQPVADIGGPGFAYPVVFALPLLLFAIGGYLGRALTQPVEPPQG